MKDIQYLTISYTYSVLVLFQICIALVVAVASAGKFKRGFQHSSFGGEEASHDFGGGESLGGGEHASFEGGESLSGGEHASFEGGEALGGGDHAGYGGGEALGGEEHSIYGGGDFADSAEAVHHNAKIAHGKGATSYQNYNLKSYGAKPFLVKKESSYEHEGLGGDLGGHGGSFEGLSSHGGSESHGGLESYGGGFGSHGSGLEGHGASLSLGGGHGDFGGEHH